MPIRCPNCQHERQPWDPEPFDECPMCGVVYEKFRPPANGNGTSSNDHGQGRTQGADPGAQESSPAGRRPNRPTLGAAGIRLPGLGEGEDGQDLEDPPPTSWFWVVAIPVTLLIMAAGIHFQNPAKLLVWFTGSWTEVTRPDGFHVELPDRPSRVTVDLPGAATLAAGGLTVYRADTYGMDVYFAEIATRVPAQGMLSWGTDLGAGLAASLLGIDKLETSDTDTLFVGDEALRWEWAELEVDKERYVVEVMATGRGRTLYVITCVYNDASHLRDNARRILDSISFSP